MTWHFWKSWRYFLTLTLGLVLFALATVQAVGPHSPAISHRDLVIGVSTKAVTGILAILLPWMVQDVMDQVLKLRAELRELKEDSGTGPPAS